MRLTSTWVNFVTPFQEQRSYIWWWRESEVNAPDQSVNIVFNQISILLSISSCAIKASLAIVSKI